MRGVEEAAGDSEVVCGRFADMSALHALLRLLFPSWAFFDTAGAAPVLEVRAHAATDPLLTSSPHGWQPVVRPLKRRLWHVLFNPGGTLTLAEQTIVERWHSEIEEEVESDVTRAMVERLVAAHVAALGAARRDVQWQYRLRVGDTLPFEGGGVSDTVGDEDDTSGRNSEAGGKGEDLVLRSLPPHVLSTGPERRQGDEHSRVP